jgi:hypothetical protein
MGWGNFYWEESSVRDEILAAEVSYVLDAVYEWVIF